MNIKDVIQSQYLASLAMLKQVIKKCPLDVWDAPLDRDKFWFKAYHVLYYAHLYLKTKSKDFVHWKKHNPTPNCNPFSKEEVLEYLAFVQQEVADNIPAMDLDASSGYQWLPSNKLELQLYNIRHIQQHTGELYERLSKHKNIRLSWVVQRSKEKK
jgi:hypothetical protein